MKWLVLAGIGVFLVGMLLGILLSSGESQDQHDHGDGKGLGAEKAAAQVWTCSMHPQIKLPKPGKCPMCGMDLIPLQITDNDEGGLRELSVSEYAKKLMSIETTLIERKFVTAEVRMVGKVDFDETRFTYITAWVPGRLDRLFVDYTGVSVKKGDHLVYLYSPELLGAQEELLQSLKAVQGVQAGNAGIISQTAEETLNAVREKLRLWGMRPEQIEEIEKRGKPTDHMTIYSPSAGIVVHKNAHEGMYVKTGTRIYTVADLSYVWVQLDAYESDLMWLRYGQHVEFTVESYPGETFRGTIAFINPILTQSTRTVKVRVNVPNPGMRLKPGMFVRVIVHANVASGGKVMEPYLAGKWICPMHPDVVKAARSTCDICEMALVTTESLGYVGIDPAKSDKPLVIPASAVLITGTRAIVFIEVPDKEKPTFEGREIILGPRAGDYYLVRHGLKEGERVVTKGSFKLDAELQIRAKPSMMTPEAGGGGHGDTSDLDISAITRSRIRSVLSAASSVESVIDGGDLSTIRAAFSEFAQRVEAVDKESIQGHAGMLWKEYAMLLGNDGVEGKEVRKFSEARRVYELLKQHTASMMSALGITHEHGDRTSSAIDPEFHKQLNSVLESYLAIGRALSQDRVEEAIGAAQKTGKALGNVDMKLLSGEDHMAWMKHEAELKSILARMSGSKEIEAIRKEFSLFSDQIMLSIQRLGSPGGTLYRFKCTMVFEGKGAAWLQSGEETRNPYYGGEMLGCGDVIEVIRGRE